MKPTGIKKAINVSKQCGYYNIMYDSTTNEIWVDQFESSNSWKEYHDKNIIKLAQGNGENSIFGWDKITMQEIKDYITEYNINPEEYYYNN